MHQVYEPYEVKEPFCGICMCLELSLVRDLFQGDNNNILISDIYTHGHLDYVSEPN